MIISELFIQKNSAGFYLPKDSTTPVILIGAGTGVAPFMGFLQERAEQKHQNIDVGQVLIFFGCRHPKQDYIYQERVTKLCESITFGGVYCILEGAS